MSLKAFHIVFIVVAALLCAGFGLWSLGRHMGGYSGAYLLLGLVSLAGSVGLGIYGRAFLAKTKDVGYL